jgi:hypothetical protein
MKPLLTFLALAIIGTVFSLTQVGCTNGYYAYGAAPYRPVPVPVYRPPVRVGYYGGGYYRGGYHRNYYGRSGSYNGYRGGSASWGGGSGSWSGPRGGSGSWRR